MAHSDGTSQPLTSSELPQAMIPNAPHLLNLPREIRDIIYEYAHYTLVFNTAPFFRTAYLTALRLRLVSKTRFLSTSCDLTLNLITNIASHSAFEDYTPFSAQASWTDSSCGRSKETRMTYSGPTLPCRAFAS